MITRHADASGAAMRETRSTPAARQSIQPSKRRTPDTNKMRQQRCRLGSLLTGEAKAPEAAPAEAQEPSGEVVPAMVPRAAPRSGSRLIRTTLTIVVLLLVGVLLLNRVPWQSVSSNAPAAAALTVGPPDSLVRGTREGTVGARDYFRVWRHAGVSPVSGDDRF
jgi:hypothetical protein